MSISPNATQNQPTPATPIPAAAIRSPAISQTPDAGHVMADDQTNGGAVCVRCVPPASLLELAGRGVEPCPVFSQEDERGGFDGVPTVVALVLGVLIWAGLIVMALV